MVSGANSVITKSVSLIVIENFSDQSDNAEKEVQKTSPNENEPLPPLRPHSPISLLLIKTGLIEYQSVFDNAVSPNSLCTNI